MQEPIWQTAERLGLASRGLPWWPDHGELRHCIDWPNSADWGEHVFTGTRDETLAFLARLETARDIVHVAIAGASR